MTTRYRPDNLRALWSTMHEGGHGLSFRRVAPEAAPLAARQPAVARDRGSQSRTWENLVGRSLPSGAAVCPRCSGSSRRSSRSTSSWYRRSTESSRPDPRRGRRGHVLAPHHPPLRARAGARRRHARPGPTCRKPGTRSAGAARRRGARRACAACSRTCTGRAPATATSDLCAWQRPRRPDLAGDRGRPARPRRPARGGRARSALRDAARAAVPARRQVPADGGARAGDRRERDRPAALPRLPALQGRGPPAA